MVMQIRPDGTGEIYRHGRQYLRVYEDNCLEPKWQKHTSSGLKPVSKKRASRLERAYQNPATKRFVRSPRFPLEPELGQPVFHNVLGYGTVTDIKGHDVTFASRMNSAVTHTVKAEELITKAKAGVEFGTCYFAGGAKAWRRAAGKWASLYKNLCLMEGKGAYGTWLKRFDLNRSSIDDLIRRFEDEERLKAEPPPILPESGKTDTPQTAVAEGSPYVFTDIPQVNERTPDPENDERQKQIQSELGKRVGTKPTPHKTILFLQHRHVDPERLALYNAIKTEQRNRVDAIMGRKIDEGIDEVLALQTKKKARTKRRRQRVNFHLRNGEKKHARNTIA